MDNLYFYANNIFGDFLNKTFRCFLKTFVICSMCFVIFTGVGYYYLNKNIIDIDKEVQNEPYYQSITENKGILLTLNNVNTFFYLDFLENKLTVSLKPQFYESQNVYGYSCDYKVKGDNELLSLIIDNVGGVELKIEDEKLRYTGIQVANLLNHTDSIELRREIISSVCNKIAKYGVNSGFFGDIINNSETELTLFECYFWDDHFKEICNNIVFID